MRRGCKLPLKFQWSLPVLAVLPFFLLGNHDARFATYHPLATGVIKRGGVLFAEEVCFSQKR